MFKYEHNYVAVHIRFLHNLLLFVFVIFFSSKIFVEDYY